MEYRRLGRTGLQVSLLSLGTGGPSAFGQSRGATLEEQRALVHGALEMGVNFFDTAAAYRSSEEILGRTLKSVPRDRYILATKCSLSERGSRDLVSADAIISQCERSLTRLGTDVIDVYQLHGVEPDRYDEVVERLYPALDKLRRDGKVRFLGVTELFGVDPAHSMLERAVPSGLWDTVMVKYGILNQTAAERVFPLCQQHDVGVLNMAAVRHALATPEALSKLIAEWTDKGLLPKDALPADDPLGWLIEGETDSIISASYKFGAEPPAVSTVLSGTSRLEHLRENVAAISGAPLPREHVERLQAVFGGIAEGGV